MRDRWTRVWKTFRRHRPGVVGAGLVLCFLLTGALASVVAPYDPVAVSLAETLQRPSRSHWLGTDNQGRDVLSRIVFGARLSLYVGIGSVAFGGCLGVLSGLFAGYSQALRMPIMRLMDILLAFPGIVIALVAIVVLGPGVRNVVFAVGLSQVPQFGRVMYGLVLTIREETFVEAARSIGASDAGIMFRHIAPNAVGPIIVQTSLLLPAAILTGASLSFLGAGVPPPTPEWGAMLSDSRQWMQVAPHLVLAPGVALILVILGFNILGDGLRDALDPRAHPVPPPQ